MKKDMICPKCGELGFSRASVYVTNGDLKCEHCGEWSNEHKWEPLLSWKEYRAELTAALQEKVNALSALAQIREVITLAAAPMGITGEPEEVVKALADKAAGAVKLIAAIEAEYNQKTNSLIERHAAQLLTAREQGRREGATEAAGTIWAMLKDEKTDWSLNDAYDKVAALSPKGEVCQWVYPGGCGNPYETSCGAAPSMKYGQDDENGYKFCPYCSRPITIKEG